MLFVVLLVSTILALVLLHPGNFKDFSRSLISVSLFSSNIFFYLNSGYFEGASELDPLLHTWSLAVEEQFYLLYPLLLMAFWYRQTSRQLLVVFILIVGLISLTISQIGVSKFPDANFYLLPSRLWELLVGCLTAYLVFDKEKLRSGGLAFLGLLLIGYAIFFFNKYSPLPGVYSLIPTVGTALILAFSRPGTLAYGILSNKIMVLTGLLSYSAYLWHQPIFAFSRHVALSELSDLSRGLLCGFVFAVSFLSWKFVEVPFRDRSRFSNKIVFAFSFIGLVSLLIVGLVGNKHYLKLKPTSGDQSRILKFRNYDRQHIYRVGDCFLMPEQSAKEFKNECTSPLSEETILIWGDSHAAALSFGLRQRYDSLLQLTSSGCPPLLGADLNQRPKCKAINRHVLSVIEKLQPSKIWLHANWQLFDIHNWGLYDSSRTMDLLESTLDYLHNVAPLSEVVVIGGVPHWTPDLPTLMFSYGLSLRDKLYFENKRMNEIATINDAIKRASKSKGATFISPVDLMCDEKECLVSIGYKGEVMPSAWDYGHLTAASSVFLVDKIDQNLQSLKQKDEEPK